MVNLAPRRRRSSVLVLLALSLLAPVTVVRADPPSPDAKDKMIAAYKEVESYESEVTVNIERTQGRWTFDQRGTFKVAFDRATDRLMLDRPDFMVVADGTKVRLLSPQIKGHHLEADAPKPLSWEQIVKAAPFVADPPLPDVAMLLSDDPLATLGDGAARNIVAGGTAEEPTLSYDGKEAKVQMTLDGKTGLVKRVVLLPPAGPQGQTIRVMFDVRVTGANQPVAEERFALDLKNSKAVDSPQALMQAARAQAQNAGPARHPLEGQEAPKFALVTMDGKPYKLEDDKARVVVLDFWATWCGPCRRALPKVQSVADWAAREKKDVAVYAVNIEESAEDARRMWDQMKLTLPVLMDGEGEVARAYQARSIPQTVVIAGGKVVAVHVGYNDKLDTDLKTEIDKALAGQ